MRVTDDSEGSIRVRDAVHTVGIPEGVGGPHANLRATPSPLDSFNISVQRSRKGMIELNGERWHTREFRLFAQKYLEFTFTYEGIDFLGNYKYCRHNLTPRWSEYRRKFTLARIYSWAEFAAMENALLGKPLEVAHLVTLTVKHDVTGSYRSHLDTVNKLRGGWSGIRFWLSRSGVKYLRVIEPGERHGYAHIHMVIIGGSDAFCEELITRWLRACPDSSRRGQNYQRVEDIKHVGAYVAKYLSKSFEGDNSSKEYLHWLELCYRLRLRCFSMDACSSRYIKYKYMRMPSGVGVCEIRDNEEQLKTVDTIGIGNHTDNDDSENRGGATAAAPPSHRSRGGAGGTPSRIMSRYPCSID